MKPIARYALARHTGPYASWPLGTPLLRDGVPTGTTVPGYVLDGQYDTPLGALLLLSWDAPFEDATMLVLLDARDRVVARASIAPPSASGLLHGHWVDGCGALVLHFMEADFHRVVVRPPWPVLGRAPRITVSTVPPARHDARMRAAATALRTELAAIAAAHAGDAMEGDTMAGDA